VKRVLRRPVVRARLPRSLYPVAVGESVYEFDIPGCAGMPDCGGLITVRRHIDGRAEVVVSRFDARDIAVIAQPDAVEGS
jgi:hypothetical protein